MTRQDEEIERVVRNEVIRIATTFVGRNHTCCADIAPGYDLSVKSWCAVFALKVLSLAKLTKLNWPQLVAKKWFGGLLPTTTSPKPGDIGVIVDTNNDGVAEYHHAVVQRVDGDRIHTVDGNSIGRVVRLRDRARHEFDVFYSIEPLLGHSVPNSLPTRKGIDVSAWQHPDSLDWGRLRELGYSFAYVRGVKMGRELDAHAVEHVRRARETRLAVGLYAFFVPGRSATEQVQLMRDAQHACGIGPADLAPALDIESYSGGKASPSWVSTAVEILTEYARLWSAAVRYHNVHDWGLMGCPQELTRFPLWLADYTPPADLPCAIWQHKSAAVPGYGKTLDQNIAHADLPRIGHPMERAVIAPPLG